MNHLDYYRYQTQARGVHGLKEIREIAISRDHVYQRIVLPYLPPQKKSNIVELACGHGSFLYWLKDKGYHQVMGIEGSPEQVAAAREVGCLIEQADLVEWLTRQPDQSVDVLLGIDLAEHLSKDDFMELLKQSHRVLSAGGTLMLRYPNGDSPLVGLNLFNDITHVWTYTTNCIETLSRMHGFSNVQFKDESNAALRDNRWLKIPVSKISLYILRGLIRAATRENIRHWSPHIWAFLRK
jgi:SAM-dependent methyltransferase